ncbi:alpha-galactosidase [Allorhizocola rhizosphaerae]|uniref:alpha-galactosidase n=1 Tax=Allorhizocola rhizosphaerae TaxID=1872709 RepID=UPI001FE2CDCE|nr:alpha-galactosidase [Allorhizocola rhizosphaerae]
MVQQNHTLRADGVGVTVVLDKDGGLPRMVHWGTDPGVGVPDVAYRSSALPLLPVQHEGWAGRPAIAGDRDGRWQHLRLRLDGEVELTGTSMVVRARDDEAGVAVESIVEVTPQGVVKMRHSLTNVGPGVWSLANLRCFLPVPDEAVEKLDMTGRWALERAPQRGSFGFGAHVRESRRGRTGHDATLLLSVGTQGFANRTGEIWSVHVGWSGNHEHTAERLPDAIAALGGGELLEPGEVRLAEGETYHTPTVYFVHSGQGLDGIRDRMYRLIRARESHPRTPRPVVLNTWEAVYFDHNLDKLKELADTAARVGVERFVLDDGWFRHRRDDRAGLGDWFVDETVWPNGLEPLVKHVHGLGMQFGLWFEPEMVNPDSDLFRGHPDWVLAMPGRLPAESRNQHVLDVSRPEVFDYLLGRIAELVSRLDIDYIKWDHNRDVHEPTSVHRQTLAVYELLRTLKARFPELEIESCSSGGARIDLGILQHTDRVWTSDTNDPIDRQQIQLWTGLLLPPELMGAHVGPKRTHVTGRVTDLHLRCVTALFGHAGMEADITAFDELDLLTEWVALYKAKRELIHTGRVVVPDLADPSAVVHGVVSQDGTHALFSYAQTTSTPANIPRYGAPFRLRLPGLNPDLSYETRVVFGPHGKLDLPEARWTGRALSTIGLPMPRLNPADALVLELVA